jgi:hypothetical protein
MDPRAPGSRAFVTNDLGRFLPDGNLEHLGRVDRAVKIGGLRVDLSELEAALRATDLFQEVVVTTFQDISEGCRLVTYVVPRLGKDCSFPVGRQSLQQLLPVPSRFVMLRELPVLASGKIDRAQLSEKAAQTLAKEDQAGSRPRRCARAPARPHLGEGPCGRSSRNNGRFFCAWGRFSRCCHDVGGRREILWSRSTRIFFARSYDCPKTRRSNQEWRLG